MWSESRVAAAHQATENSKRNNLETGTHIYGNANAPAAPCIISGTLVVGILSNTSFSSCVLCLFGFSFCPCSPVLCVLGSGSLLLCQQVCVCVCCVWMCVRFCAACRAFEPRLFFSRAKTKFLKTGRALWAAAAGLFLYLLAIAYSLTTYWSSCFIKKKP